MSGWWRALAVMALAGGLVAAATVVSAPVARAAPADARARKLLARGERLFADQEYTRALRALLPVTRDPAATRAQRVRAWELIALSRFILGDQPGARDAFERVLEADPGFQLRDESGSPRIRAFFDEVRAAVVPGAGGGVDLEHAAPRAGTAGTRLEIEARATRGGDAVHELVVLHRTLGALRYAETAARPAGETRWRAALRLPASRRAYTIEYYLEARGPAGAVVARVGAPDQPLALRIAAGGERRRWYGRWYVIAGAAALAAGTTGLVLAAGGGRDDGSLPPGRVVVTP